MKPCIDIYFDSKDDFIAALNNGAVIRIVHCKYTDKDGNVKYVSDPPTDEDKANETYLPDQEITVYSMPDGKGKNKGVGGSWHMNVYIVNGFLSLKPKI